MNFLNGDMKITEILNSTWHLWSWWHVFLIFSCWSEWRQTPCCQYELATHVVTPVRLLIFIYLYMLLLLKKKYLLLCCTSCSFIYYFTWALSEYISLFVNSYVSLIPRLMTRSHCSWEICLAYNYCDITTFQILSQNFLFGWLKRNRILLFIYIYI